MFLAEHHILLAAPPFIQLTETTISVSIILPLPVFFPDQLQGQMFVSLQLPPDVGKVRQRAGELGRPAPAAGNNNSSNRRSSRSSAGFVSLLQQIDPGFCADRLRDRLLASVRARGAQNPTTISAMAKLTPARCVPTPPTLSSIT
jgi:hypothetical protein